MKVFVVMSNVFGWVMEVCKTKEIAEQVIRKDMDYYKFKGSKYEPKKEDYIIEEKELKEK